MPGTYVFKPIEANLTHDTDWLGNMDPYCAYMINNKRVKGQICKNGGMHPYWNETTTVPIEVDQPACVVELMDKDRIIPDDSIGTFVIDLTEVKNKGLVSRWYPIYHKNKPAGEILFETTYQPEFVEPLPAVEIKPTFVPTPIITETQPVIQETIVKEVITEKPVMTPVLSTSTYGMIPASEGVHTVLKSKITSHELSHTGKGCLEDPMYGKTVGVSGIEHIGGIPYSQSQFVGQSNVINQPLGTQVNQPLGTQMNQPLGTQMNQPLGTQMNQPLGTQMNQPFGSTVNQTLEKQYSKTIGTEQGLGSEQVRQPGQGFSKENLPL